MAAAGGDGLTIPRRRMPKNGENRSWCFLTPTKQEIKQQEGQPQQRARGSGRCERAVATGPLRVGRCERDAAKGPLRREGRSCMAVAGGPLRHSRCGRAAAGGPLMHGRCGRAAAAWPLLREGRCCMAAAGKPLGLRRCGRRTCIVGCLNLGAEGCQCS